MVGRALVRILVTLAIALALVWLASNEDQRCATLEALHLPGALGRCRAPGRVPRDRGLDFRLGEPTAWDFIPLAGPGRDHHPTGLGSPCRQAGPANPSQKAKGRIYRWTGPARSWASPRRRGWKGSP